MAESDSRLSAGVVRRYTGHERGVPVVRVEEHRTAHQAGQGRERREREEGEAARVVRVVDGVLAVDPRAVEVPEVLDEEHLRAGPGARRPVDPGLLDPVAHRHQERRADRLEIGLDVADGAVERQDRQHVEAGGLLKGGEAVHGLREPAGPGKGKVLRRDVDDRDGLATRAGQRGSGVCRRHARLLNG